MNNEEVLNQLRLARAYCGEQLIWFAPALYQCEITLTERVPIAAIDRNYNIYFNPKAVIEIKKTSSSLQDGIEQLAFLWIHEISHELRVHSDRAIDIKANAKIWNYAADLEINDGEWTGLKMPKAFPGLLPTKLNLPNGQLAEWYYHEILENKELQKGCQNCFQNGEGEGKGEEEEKGKGKGNGNENIGNGPSWDEGSGVHGEPRPWEEDGSPQKLHPIDREIIANDVAKKMQENRKQIGTMPGSWGLWIEEILESRTDWKKILHHRMSSAIAIGIGLRVDYTFARPSRRQSVYHPIITPSFSGSRSGSITVVVDTSGSMGGSTLGQAVGEVCKVLEDFKMPVTVIPCDAQAYEPIILKTNADRFKIQQLKGGGGTNMIVGIDAALNLKPKPDTILVLTDGYTPYPERPYKIPVVFGIIKKDPHQSTPKPKTPPWKETSVIDIVIKK